MNDERLKGIDVNFRIFVASFNERKGVRSGAEQIVITNIHLQFIFPRIDLGFKSWKNDVHNVKACG